MTLVKVRYKVELIKSEAGQGHNVDSTKYFDTEQDAYEYQNKFNDKNDDVAVPGLYMYATKPEMEVVK